MSFADLMNETILIERDDCTVSYQVSFQTGQIFGPFDMEVKVDDFLTRKLTGERFVVTDVARNKSPIGNDVDHCKLTIISEAKHRKNQEERPATHITQHIAMANTVAGRDIHGGVNTTVTVELILDGFAAAVEADKSIPAEEKKTLLGHLTSLAANPYISGIAMPLVLEALKKRLGLVT